MTSIYQQALGSEFNKLHPKIQERFGFSSKDNKAAIGTGAMEKIWHGRIYTLPFLYVGNWRNIMFTANGDNVPFIIENYAYKDSFGRETVTWIRKFQFKEQQRRFDATMIYSGQHKKIVDYLGTHQHLAVDIDLSVDEKGGLKIRSGAQRFYEGFINFSWPMFFSGTADVCEWYDEKAEKFKIDMQASNKVWGPLFGYKGTFSVEYINIRPENIPADAKPVREEARE
jgi:hypothetical protein